MAPIEIDDFSERNLHLWARDFPWRTVSHNQMVIGHQNQHGLDSVPRFHRDRPDFPISQNSTNSSMFCLHSFHTVLMENT